MERHEWNVRFRTAEEKAATVRRLKAFAATNGLSMPDALERLLIIADLFAADDGQNQKQSGTKRVFIRSFELGKSVTRDIPE